MKLRFVHQLLILSTAVAGISGCALSPTSVGHERGEYFADGILPCGEIDRSAGPVLNASPGNQALRCVMAEASALRNDYLFEVGQRERVRNGFFAITSVAAAVIILNEFDEIFGPVDNEHPAKLVASGSFLGFGMNRLFNTPATQEIYRQRAGALICEQSVVSPFLIDDKLYTNLTQILRGSNTRKNVFKRHAEARGAFRLYRSAVALAGPQVAEIEDSYLNEIPQILSTATEAADWGVAFLDQVEQKAPNRLREQIVRVRDAGIAQLLQRAVAEEDVRALILNAPTGITTLLGNLRPAEFREGGSDFESQSLMDQSLTLPASRETFFYLEQKRNKMEEALAALEADVLELASLSRSITADFAELVATGQCDLEDLPLGLSTSISSHRFTQGIPSDIDFTVEYGQTPFVAKVSSDDRGITTEIEADGNSRRGTITYDGSASDAEVVVTVSEIMRPSIPAASIRIVIRSQSTLDNPQPEDENGNNIPQSRTQASSERVYALQRALNTWLDQRIEEDGIYGETTRMAHNTFRAQNGLSTPIEQKEMKLEPAIAKILLTRAIQAAQANTSFDTERAYEQNLPSEKKLELMNQLSGFNLEDFSASSFSSGPITIPQRLPIILFQYTKAADNSNVKVTGILDATTVGLIEALDK